MFNTPKTNRFEARALLLEAYQQVSGLFDHIKHAQVVKHSTKEQKLALARPLAVIAAHRGSTVSSKSIMQDHYLEYRSADVLKYTGTTWPEYLTLEPRQARMLVAMGKMERDEEAQRKDRAERELEDSIERQGQPPS